jgi:hypothetical protein
MPITWPCDFRRHSNKFRIEKSRKRSMSIILFIAADMICSGVIRGHTGDKMILHVKIGQNLDM